jgi:hypothetical protein
VLAGVRQLSLPTAKGYYAIAEDCNSEYRRFRFQGVFTTGPKSTTFDARIVCRPLPDRVNGAILIWGAISDSGRKVVIADYNFADVLSVEAILDDLRVWAPTQWNERINQLSHWSEELFTYLH